MSIKITKVISYKNAWFTINKNEHSVTEEINKLFVPINADGENDNLSERYIFSELEKALKGNGWNQLKYGSSVFNDGDRRLKTILYYKNRTAISISKPNVFDTWLFQDVQIVQNDNLIDFPILLAPSKLIYNNDRKTKKNQFETIKLDLLRLAPLVIPYPFLVFGYDIATTSKGLEVIEIQSANTNTREKLVVERFIEFAPEYYQAGINIISFFGSYIKRRYPEEKVKVSIEQNNNIVRLKIVANDGKIEIIEKALDEYQSVISGNKTPEEVTNDPLLILELRNEIRSAENKINLQKDIIGYQNARIDKLLDIVGDGLSNQKPISIVVNQNNNVALNQKISPIFGILSELKELIPNKNTWEIDKILNIEKELDKLSKEQDPDNTKKSSAMSKLRRFVFDLNDKESSLYNIMEKIDGGIDIIKDLAGKYNGIAEWCGLPQVPKVFVKK